MSRRRARSPKFAQASHQENSSKKADQDLEIPPTRPPVSVRMDHASHWRNRSIPRPSNLSRLTLQTFVRVVLWEAFENVRVPESPYVSPTFAPRAQCKLAAGHLEKFVSGRPVGDLQASSQLPKFPCTTALDRHASSEIRPHSKNQLH